MMTRMMKLLMIAIVGLSLTLTGIVMAQGWSNGPGKGHRGPWQERGMGPGYGQYHRGMGPYGQHRYGMGPGYFHQYGVGLGALLGNEMFEARATVLAELSGQTVKEIQEQMKTKSFRVLFDEYQINPEEFRTKMHAKMVLLVNQAAKAGKITEDQAKAIYERMNWMGQRSFTNGPCWGNGFRK